MSSVIAVIVSYQPDFVQLASLLKAISPQTASVVVVDNSATTDVGDWLAEAGFATVHYLPLGENFGVAAAQNKGIAWAREQGADYVVLFDQDSEPETDMVARLLAAASEMGAQGYAVAAVGPRYLDTRQNNPPPFIRVSGLHLERCACAAPDSIVPVDYLISSGCLIPMATLDAVGGMVEELFIDYVDIEWGLRAKYRGFQSYGVCAAQMRHSLGDNPITFRGRKIPLHSPLRHYYHFRNAVWLYRQAWIPANWKWVDGWRLLLKYGFYTLFAKPRFKQFAKMTLGIWHGLTGRLGRLSDC